MKKVTVVGAGNVGATVADVLAQKNFLDEVVLIDIKEGLGFSPLTGEIAAIGVLDTGKNQGVVYFQAPDVEIEEYKEAGFVFKPKTEKEMLINFWQGIKNYSTIVTFNGQAFDLPFIMIRSAANKVKPSINLFMKRYLNYQGYPVEYGKSGPDDFGYYWIDSDEPSGPVFEWIDVSLTGIDLVDSLDDDTCSGPYDLGFDFPFYGDGNGINPQSAKFFELI